MSDVLYTWLLIPCTDCCTESKCQRNYEDIISFLTETSTIRAIGKEGIMAFRTLAHSLYTNRVKCSAYRTMHLKYVVSAMTMTPVEGQLSQTRKTGVSTRTHLEYSLKILVYRVKRNLDRRNLDAHRELASVNMSSRLPTNVYLIGRGEALVCRYHENCLGLKSVQLLSSTWITWENSSVERESRRPPLYSKITRMLRVSRL